MVTANGSSWNLPRRSLGPAYCWLGGAADEDPVGRGRRPRLAVKADAELNRASVHEDVAVRRAVEPRVQRRLWRRLPCRQGLALEAPRVTRGLDTRLR